MGRSRETDQRQFHETADEYAAARRSLIKRWTEIQQRAKSYHTPTAYSLKNSFLAVEYDTNPERPGEVIRIGGSIEFGAWYEIVGARSECYERRVRFLDDLDRLSDRLDAEIKIQDDFTYVQALIQNLDLTPEQRALIQVHTPSNWESSWY